MHTFFSATHGDTPHQLFNIWTQRSERYDAIRNTTSLFKVDIFFAMVLVYWISCRIRAAAASLKTLEKNTVIITYQVLQSEISLYTEGT